MSQVMQQAEFMTACEQPQLFLSEIVNGDSELATAWLYRDLIAEEADEIDEALSALQGAGSIDEKIDALTKVAREAADLLYVTYGFANSLGIPIDKVFAEIHRSNMLKVQPDGKVWKREDGKTLKPADWEAPKVRRIIQAALRG